jgi:creatinine amidohydrolase/Fe(II)-dependent formamide hydrolase-like protein
MVAEAPPSRSLGELTSPEISRRLNETSILCLPIGAIEQHGPHLPLSTDAVIAEELARRIVGRWAGELDLWLLPTISISLSREHDWAPGTLSLGIETFVALIKNLGREIVRALPARNMLMVSGHGGNRGILDNLMHELQSQLGLNVCVIHPFDLSKASTGDAIADVHGGKSETSVMLALAPHLVRRELIDSCRSADPDAVSAMIFDRGASFAWRTDDRRLAVDGIIGDPRGASPELGDAIVESVVMETRGVLARLLENRSRAPHRSRGD